MSPPRVSESPPPWHGPGAWHGCPCGSKSPLCRRAGKRKPMADKGRLFACRRGDPAPGTVPTAPRWALGGRGGGRGGMLTARCRPVAQQIYPDPELEVQVLSLAIRCIHSEEGCRWSGLIKHLQVGAGGQGEERGLRLGGALDPPPPSLTVPAPPGPPRHLRLQRRPLPQPLQRQAEPPRPARARAARLPQAQGQVRVLRHRLHRGGLRGGHRGGGHAGPGGGHADGKGGVAGSQGVQGGRGGPGWGTSWGQILAVVGDAAAAAAVPRATRGRVPRRACTARTSAGRA